MMATMINSQSTEAKNSAISNIFSKKSVLEFANYIYNKMANNPNESTGKISVIVGDGYRMTVDCGMDKNGYHLVLNMYLEEKNGNRYCRIRRTNTGWMDMTNEYKSNGSWKSVVVYTIKDNIESMVEGLLNYYTEDNDKYLIKEWEKITNMVYDTPSLEEAPMLYDTPCLNDNYMDITENPASAMTLCEYVMLNGKNTNWGSVYDTFNKYSLEDVGIENIPETIERDFCYVSIRETLIDIVKMFRLGGGYDYTDGRVVIMIRLFTKLYEQLMDIADPDDIEE